METIDDPWATTEMMNAIQFGTSYMTGLYEYFYPGPVVDCPTGYCDFGVYQTLGIASECKNRSNDIREESDGNTYLTIPGTDLKLYNKGTQKYDRMIITTNSYTDYDKEIFGKRLGPLIVRTALLIDTEEEEPVAMECALYWNVRTCSGAVDPTTYYFMYETPLGDDWDFTEPGSDGSAFTGHSDPDCWVNNRTISKEEYPDLWEEKCVYAVGNEAHNGIRNFLLDPKDGFVGDSIMKSRDTDSGVNEFTRTNDFVTNVEALAGSKRDDVVENIPLLFSNVAVLMSHVVRRRGTRGTNGTYTTGATEGYVYRYVFRYRVLWERMIIPAFLVIGSAMFVFITAVLTAREHAWRRSNLPLLFHGLGEAERNACGEPLQLESMELLAKGMCVRLEDGEEGTRIVGR
jgi:hypothetical protein